MTMLLLLRLLPNRVVAEGGPRPCGCHSWHHQELDFWLATIRHDVEMGP